MKIKFYKYQGAGNDFVLIDNRTKKLKLSVEKIALFCNRNFGVGADGLMLLQKKKGYDFEMIYYNSDGKPSSMCGNGGRCIVAFARQIGAVKKSKVSFLAIDGPHEAEFKGKEVKLQMKEVKDIEHNSNYFFLNTGSPHYVSFVKNVKSTDVYNEGRRIRYNERFRKEGTNVNFVEVIAKDKIYVRTYERGVENETLSCGTGVTASALAYAEVTHKEKGTIQIVSPGGKLKVQFKKGNKGYKEIYLQGPAEKTFEGEINI